MELEFCLEIRRILAGDESGFVVQVQRQTAFEVQASAEKYCRLVRINLWNL